MNYITLNGGIGGFRRGVDVVVDKAVNVAAVEEDMQAYRTYHLLNDTTKERMLPTVDPLSVMEEVDVIYGDLTRQYMYFDPERKRKELKLTPAVVDEWVRLNNPKSVVLFFRTEDAEVNQKELVRFSQSLSDKGYSISLDVVYSYYLGVAQHRKDLIVVAVKDRYVEKKDLTASHRDTEVDALKVKLNIQENIDTFEFNFPSLLTETMRERLSELNRVIGLLERENPLTSLVEDDIDLDAAKEERCEILSNGQQSVGVLLQDILEDEVDEVFLSSPHTTNQSYRVEGLSPKLQRVNQGVSPHTIIYRERKEREVKGKVVVRALTPLEYWRLQGYTDADYIRMQQEELSRQKMYNLSLLTVIPHTTAALTRNLMRLLTKGENRQGKKNQHE